MVHEALPQWFTVNSGVHSVTPQGIRQETRMRSRADRAALRSLLRSGGIRDEDYKSYAVKALLEYRSMTESSLRELRAFAGLGGLPHRKEMKPARRRQMS